MAFILFKSGKYKFVTATQGNQLWLVMQGEEKGTAKQRQFAKTVKHLYLNRCDAPPDYLRQHKDYIPTHDNRDTVPAAQLRLPYKD